jgi:hypothetical protein
VPSVSSVVKLFRPAELEPSLDAEVALPSLAFALALFRITRCESHVLRPNQFYLFWPKVYRLFVIENQARLTVNLDAWHVPAAIHFLRWKLA